MISFYWHADRVTVIESELEGLVNVGFLAQMKNPILTVSLNGHPEVIAARSKACHLEAVPESPLDSFYLCDAWSNDQEIVNVYRNIHVAPDENTKVGIDWLETKDPQEVCERLVPDTRCLFQAVKCLPKPTNPR